MPRESYRFSFQPSVPFAEALLTLQLARIAAEGVYGDWAVRISQGTQRFDADRRAITLESDTDIGHAIARVFARFLEREFGEDAFTLTRSGRATAPWDEADEVRR